MLVTGVGRNRNERRLPSQERLQESIVVVHSGWTRAMRDMSREIERRALEGWEYVDTKHRGTAQVVMRFRRYEAEPHMAC